MGEMLITKECRNYSRTLRHALRASDETPLHVFSSFASAVSAFTYRTITSFFT